jgi:hypothetical protein
MIRRPELHLLSIDANERTMTRYVHKPGTWGVLNIGKAEIPEESVGQLGSDDMRPVLEKFRLTGRAE